MGIKEITPIEDIIMHHDKIPIGRATKGSIGFYDGFLFLKAIDYSLEGNEDYFNPLLFLECRFTDENQKAFMVENLNYWAQDPITGSTIFRSHTHPIEVRQSNQ